MGKINSRQKGAAGEREWSRWLNENFDLSARRGRQYAGHPDAPDVVGGWPGTHAEVKRVEKVSIDKWMAKAIEDAGDQVPYVAHRRNRCEWFVTIRASDIQRFADAVTAAKEEA
jgi:hypothetical protein